jgi:S1-C subfamily serine protease
MEDMAKTSKPTEQDSSNTTPRSNVPQKFTVHKLVTMVKHAPWQRLGAWCLVIVIAGAAGFMGGRLNSDSAPASILAGQKQIVTSQGQLINAIAKNVGPSVVSVNVTTQATTSSFFGLNDQAGNQQAAGTGIIISKDGVIMTNRHVVPTGTTEVSVTLSDGTQYDNVEVLGRTGSSDSLDVAFLKIKDLKGKTVTPAVIGSSESMRVGDSVVAIGNALGEFQNTVTAGIISGFGRQVQAGSDNGGFGNTDTEELGNLIQTDAAINEGNSGGPLVNMNGQVIGINTAIASGAENVGFAIPMDDVKGLINQVLKSGSFARPYLGVHYIALTATVAKDYALPVNSGAYLAPSGISGTDPVLTGSPADKAGLRAGDIITAVNGRKISPQTNLTTLLNKFQPGDKVNLKVLRGGKTITITAILGKTNSN